MKNIGLIIIATNKYREFLDDLLKDVRTKFLINHNVEIFVFSDQPVKNVTWIETEHRPWPWMTLGRYELIKKLPKKDYYFYIDVDSRIINPIRDEILTKRLAVAHSGFKGGRGTPENNPASLAYISDSTNFVYCHGGFQGGSEFLNDSQILAERIKIDFSNGIIAKWHDESHWNRYLLEFPPSVLLPHTYCCHKHYNDKSKIYFVKKEIKEYQK